MLASAVAQRTRAGQGITSMAALRASQPPAPWSQAVITSSDTAERWFARVLGPVWDVLRLREVESDVVEGCPFYVVLDSAICLASMLHYSLRVVGGDASRLWRDAAGHVRVSGKE